MGLISPPSLEIVSFPLANGSFAIVTPSPGRPILRVSDKPTEHRRLQGILQGRPAEDRLAAHGGTQEALPDTLGHVEGRDDII